MCSSERTLTYRYDDDSTLDHDLTNLILQVLELLTDETPNALMIHASAFSMGPATVLVAGPPLSGKTTLAVQAMARGWSASSGERLVLDARTKRVVAGTPLDNVSGAVAARFFPALSAAFLSAQAPPHPPLPSTLLREAPIGIIVVPKMTDGLDKDGVYATKLSINMARRFLTLDTGCYAAGSFALHGSTVPARYLDTQRRRKERWRRLSLLCGEVPTVFLEGPPFAVLNWLHAHVQ